MVLVINIYFENYTQKILNFQLILGTPTREITHNNRILQISTLEKDYVVDGLTLREFIPKYLTEIFEDPSIIKIMHGCDADLPLLASNFDIFCENLFDTSRAFSLIRDISEDKNRLISLEKLIQKLLNVKIDKFFQLADWRIRPLPPAMLHYARTDSHYLIYLYHILTHMLNGEVVWSPYKYVSNGQLLVRCASECNTLLFKRLNVIKNRKVRLLIKQQL